MTATTLITRATDAHREARVRVLPPAAYAEAARRSVRVLTALRGLAPSDLISRRPPDPRTDLVSVIIPMRNASEWIELCLKGILAQTHRDLEVFCVDDCSEDDTYDRVVDQFGSDRRLAVFRLARRVGPYQIKNWVLAGHARGRWIALQDADDVSHPARLGAQLAWMRRHKLRVCGTCVHQFFPRGIRPRSGTRILMETGGYRHSLAIYPHAASVRGPAGFQGLLSARHGVLSKHGTQLFERALLLEFGGFDGHTILGADSDLNRRLLRFVDLGNVPQVLYSRRLHRDSLSRHPATGHRSTLRQGYLAACERLQLQIARALAHGDDEEARALSTADLFCADVAVAESHLGFTPT
jgi:glycosyltransferase involved in cell wall biosynthesis